MRPFRLLLACTVTAALALTAGPASAGTEPTRAFDTTVRLVVVDDGGHDGGADDGAGLHTVAMADIAGHLVALPGPTTGLRPGQRVRVTAVTGAAGLSVRSVETAAPSAGSTAPSAGSTGRAAATAPGGLPGRVDVRGVPTPVTGAHTLTLLPVYWSAPDAATRSSLTALAASTAAYWSAQSNGRIVITPTVRDWARIPDPGSCDPTALVNSALAADSLAMPVSPFDHVAVYFPQRSDCNGWAGLGQIRGNLIWDNGVPLTDVLAHEFGHNLGLGHANIATCTDGGARVTLSSSCSVQEYRDYADVMGAAMDRPTGNLNSALADWLGLATTVTATPGTPVTADLVPLGQVAGTRALRVRVGSNWLYADYRPAVGPDTRVPAWAGVQLHLLPDGDYPQSRLLDARTSSPSFSTVSLAPGSSWTIPGAGATLTVVSVGATSARLTVAPTTSGAGTPAPVITSPGVGAAVAGSATVAWRVTAPAMVRVLVDGSVRATAPAATRTGSLLVSGLTTGNHVLTAQSVDGSGTVTATSAPVAVTADATAPPSPTGLGMAVLDVLSWRASTDVGSGTAGYLVALDGAAPVRVGAVTTARVRTPVGRHTWWVAAVDRVGNVSPAAGLIVVRSTTNRSHQAAVRVTGPASGADVPRALSTARTVGGSRIF